MTEKIYQDLVCTGLVTVILCSVLKLSACTPAVPVGFIISLALMIPYNLLYSQVFANMLTVAGPMSYLQMATAWEAGWLLLRGESAVEKIRVIGWTGMLTAAAVFPSAQEVGGWSCWGYAEIRGLAQAVTFIMLLALLCSDQVGHLDWEGSWVNRQSAKLLCCWMVVRLAQTRAYVFYTGDGNSGDDAWILSRWVYIAGLAVVASGYWRAASSRPRGPKAKRVVVVRGSWEVGGGGRGGGGRGGGGRGGGGRGGSGGLRPAPAPVSSPTSCQSEAQAVPQSQGKAQVQD